MTNFSIANLTSDEASVRIVDLEECEKQIAGGLFLMDRGPEKESNLASAYLYGGRGNKS